MSESERKDDYKPAVPPVTLDEYRSLVRDVPAPTPDQMQAFAEYVSEAHSWYKHLPTLPPGARFQFYVDASAGAQRVWGADGRVQVVPREEGGFHYSWIPTREYRARFGYLAFSRSTGTSVALHLRDGRRLIPSDDEPTVYDPKNQRLVSLAAEVLQAGSARVSGIVHTHTADPFWIGHALEANPNLVWPEESGGRAILLKIVERLRALREDPACKRGLTVQEAIDRNNAGLIQVDYPLYELLAGERNRQQRGMTLAMKRVCALLIDGAA